MHRLTLSLTSALDGGAWSMPRSGHFTPGKDPVQKAGWAPEPVWMGAENHAPMEIQSPDHPARSETLYQITQCHYVYHKSQMNW